MPTLRIEIEGCRHMIVKALMDQREEIEQTLTDSLKDVDVAALVKSQVAMHLPNILQQAITEAIKSAVNQSLWDSEFGRDVLKASTQYVSEAMKGVTREPE